MIPDFPIDIRIKLAELKTKLLFPDFANLLPCWLVSVKLTQPTGQKISKVRKQQKNFNSSNLILMSIGKAGIIKFEFQATWFS